jgi:glucoamylase
VTFEVTAGTAWGEDIRVLGSTEALGNWDPARGLPLHADRYTAEQPLWYGTVRLAAGQKVDYKYVRVRDGQVLWERGANRQVEVPASCETRSIYRRDIWQ